jgi:hypothetical protein
MGYFIGVAARQTWIVIALASPVQAGYCFTRGGDPGAIASRRFASERGPIE